jgi:predicted transglutaminase-like protease
MNHAIKVSYEIAEDRIIEIEFTRKLNNQKETAFIEALQLDNQERFTLHLDNNTGEWVIKEAVSDQLRELEEEMSDLFYAKNW